MNFQYRIFQFWQDIWAAIDNETIVSLRKRFGSHYLELFAQLSAGEQAHSLRVMKWLEDHGETNQELLLAALLHDVGKSRFRLRIWERIWIVVISSVCPGWVKRYRDYQMEAIPRWKIWLRPFIVAENHPEWGADMVAWVGGSGLVVELIRDHQNYLSDQGVTIKEQLLYKLQIADRKN